MDLDHVALWVSDLDRSLAFYDALGFEQTHSFSLEGVENVYISGDAGELQLRHDPDRTTPIAPSRADVDHLAFRVSDVDAIVERALEAGGSVVAEPHVVDAPDAYAAFVEDPDGHILEFFRSLADES